MGRRGGARRGVVGHRPRDERRAETGASATAGHRRPWRSAASGAARPPQRPQRPVQCRLEVPAGPGKAGPGRFPAQQRPKGDPDVIQRGRGIFAGAVWPLSRRRRPRRAARRPKPPAIGARAQRQGRRAHVARHQERPTGHDDAAEPVARRGHQGRHCRRARSGRARLAARASRRRAARSS